jgi:hypothetical protein
VTWAAFLAAVNWGSVILQVLKLVNSLTAWAQREGHIKEGYDKAIADTTREIFRKTEHAKKVKEKIDAMSDAEVDAALVALEPSGDVPAPINR